MKLKILLVAFLSSAVLAIGHAQAPAKAKLDQFFDQLAAKDQAMGSVVLVKDGDVLYTRAIGYSQINETERKPISAATRYRIGSITKMFTAVIILQLAEEGKLQLTDTIGARFPQIPNAAKITVAQILAHRSGIHDSIIDPSLRPAAKTKPLTREELLALIAKGRPDFEPDARHAYSNSGYLILGLLIEKLTGKTYAEALATGITAKLGLEDTYVATGPIDVNKHEALTYRHLGGWKQEPETHPSLLFSAGAIISTPHDLAKFIRALFDLKLIGQDSLSTMKTIRDGDGLGMEPFQFAGRTFYGHTGGGDNYGAWLAYQPEEKLAIAYATNAKVHPVREIMHGIVDIHYQRPFQIPTFESFAVSPEVLDRYVGVYASPDAPVKMTVTRKGTTLFVQPGGQTPAPLEATALDKFRIGNPGPVFEFDAAQRQMTIKRGGRDRVFTKEN